MPPGGFRLAIVNCWDLGAGNQAATRELRRLFSARPRSCIAAVTGNQFDLIDHITHEWQRPLGWAAKL